MHRIQIKQLKEIPNIGSSMTDKLGIIGITAPSELIGQDPYQMYNTLCEVTAKVYDPCVIDVFISAVKYMEGDPPQKWWYYTQERKQTLANKS